MINPPALVVSDIDGTFLDATEQVSQRTLEVVWRMVRGGTGFLLATGRPPRWLAPVTRELGFGVQCVCSNGAVVLDSATGALTHRRELDPDTLTYLGQLVAEAIPGGGFAAERLGDTVDDDTIAPFIATPSYEHSWMADAFHLGPDAEVFATPAVKLLFRQAQWSSAALYERLAPLVDPNRAELTYSIPDGLVEFSAPQVTKATAIATLAAERGISMDAVLAFGDMPNDLDMLTQVGWGVAMGNAAPEVKARAQEVAPPNTEDGLAQVLERWF